MKLIVGLGNPGKQYTKTRHNIGFMALEHFLKDFEQEKQTVWENNLKFKSDLAKLEWQPKHGDLEKMILVKPKTFMNNSGMAVSLLANFYKLKSEDIWIIHDDLDLPLGSLRIKQGGASAGHRGLNSIISDLGSDAFWRFRLGIGKPKAGVVRKDVDDYVLGLFLPQEHSKLREVLKHASKALACSLEDSLQVAMNKFNTK